MWLYILALPWSKIVMTAWLICFAEQGRQAHTFHYRIEIIASLIIGSYIKDGYSFIFIILIYGEIYSEVDTNITSKLSFGFVEIKFRTLFLTVHMALQIKEINSRTNPTTRQVDSRAWSTQDPVRSSQGPTTQEIDSRVNLGTCLNS